ncbi:Hypothetical protein glysoja_034448 [Glycine soja]|uniref:Uncharacterized protein n=1 Tax=Glycine soja TaxID=3848 RepID=A0A0B2PU65_GLYSO|nr:Hypothetical protein glysoja_034448 [Glycine soja]
MDMVREGWDCRQCLLRGTMLVELRKLSKRMMRGNIENLVNSCEKIEDDVDCEGPCQAYGDVRFQPCETCYGSCKIDYEVNKEEEYDGEVGDYGIQRCPACNENGLIHCPMCCYYFGCFWYASIVIVHNKF